MLRAPIVVRRADAEVGLGERLGVFTGAELFDAMKIDPRLQRVRRLRPLRLGTAVHQVDRTWSGAPAIEIGDGFVE